MRVSRLPFWASIAGLTLVLVTGGFAAFIMVDAGFSSGGSASKIAGRWSRHFVFVPRGDIVGLARRVYLSIDSAGHIRLSRFGHSLR